VALGRDQHVLEAAEDMRADRLALIGASHDPRHVALGGADAEMVRPELNEPFPETGLSLEREPHPRRNLVAIGPVGQRRLVGWFRRRHCVLAVWHGRRSRDLLAGGGLRLARSPLGILEGIERRTDLGRSGIAQPGRLRQRAPRDLGEQAFARRSPARTAATPRSRCAKHSGSPCVASGRVRLAFPD